MLQLYALEGYKQSKYTKITFKYEGRWDARGGGGRLNSEKTVYPDLPVDLWRTGERPFARYGPTTFSRSLPVADSFKTFILCRRHLGGISYRVCHLLYIMVPYLKVGQ